MKDLVLDNIIFSLQSKGGISRYWAEIVSRVLLDDSFGSASFVELAGPEKNIFRQSINIPKGSLRRDDWLNPRLMQFLPVRMNRPSVFHSSYFRRTLDKRSSNIVTVYDCIYERFKKGSPAGYLHSMRTSSIKHADAVICISQNTADDVKKFYPHVESSRIHVVHLAAGDELCQLKELPVSIEAGGRRLERGSFLLYVGKRGLYKNFTALAKAMVMLKEKKADVPQLVIAGGEKELDSDHITIFEEHGLLEKVLMLSSCGTEQLNILYNLAMAYVCTSSYEGFGLPVLEAFKAGCPVITADNSSLAEVAGNAALLFDSKEPEQLAECIKDVLSTYLRKKLITAGLERTKLFSWDNTYIGTKKVYLSLMQ